MFNDATETESEHSEGAHEDIVRFLVPNDLRQISSRIALLETSLAQHRDRSSYAVQIAETMERSLEHIVERFDHRWRVLNDELRAIAHQGDRIVKGLQGGERASQRSSPPSWRRGVSQVVRAISSSVRKKNMKTATQKRSVQQQHDSQRCNHEVRPCPLGCPGLATAALSVPEVTFQVEVHADFHLRAGVCSSICSGCFGSSTNLPLRVQGHPPLHGDFYAPRCEGDDQGQARHRLASGHGWEGRSRRSSSCCENPRRHLRAGRRHSRGQRGRRRGSEAGRRAPRARRSGRRRHQLQRRVLRPLRGHLRAAGLRSAAPPAAGHATRAAGVRRRALELVAAAAARHPAPDTDAASHRARSRMRPSRCRWARCCGTRTASSSPR